MSQQVKGVVIGLVTDRDDPEGLGRIKVEYPWLGDGIESNWARIATSLAGPALGAWFLPEIGDEALLAFELGDIRRPYVLGFLWNGDAAPPSTEPSERILKTVSGHKLTFNDADGDESITLEDASGVNKVVLNKDGVSIETTKDFLVKANKVVIEAKTTLDLKATAKLSAKGNPVHLNP
jgi:uncharacterized protein involved in type VI secretion and phage assembly